MHEPKQAIVNLGEYIKFLAMVYFQINQAAIQSRQGLGRIANTRKCVRVCERRPALSISFPGIDRSDFRLLNAMMNEILVR